MRIERIEAIPIQVPRDFDGARGTAGTPNAASRIGTLPMVGRLPVLYSTELETALVRIETSDGLVGWGRAQAPLAPQVACTIVEHLLAPCLEGVEFSGTVEEIEALWTAHVLDHAVRGQTGGFMLDAIAGIDLARGIWPGKMRKRQFVSSLRQARASALFRHI